MDRYGKTLRKYARDVVAGRVVAGRLTRLACQRQLDDLGRFRRRGSPFVFVGEEVTRICAFAEMMPHVEGEWSSPTIVLEPWQVFALGCVFGWRRRDNGHRRFTTVYLEVARKNAKSAIASVVALYCLVLEGELGPQIKTAGTTGDQARIVFSVARKMALATQEFRDTFAVECFASSVFCGDNGGAIMPINAKASTQDGLNPHLSIVDELHAHKDRGLFDVLKSARGARKNPLSWYVTSAGYNVQGVCYEQRQFLVNVLEGVFQADHYFGVIYTLDLASDAGEITSPEPGDESDTVETVTEARGDDPFDESVWPKANPNLGVSVQIEEMRTYAAEARVSPDTQSEFLTKRLNVWGSARAAYLNLARFKQCETGIELGELVSLPAYGGLDLASKIDIAAFVVVWGFEGLVHVRSRFYVPESAVRPRTERDNVPYARWAAAGHLTVTPGDITDYAWIERDIREDFDAYDLRGVGFDPWNASDLTGRLLADELPMVEFRQGIPSFTGPMNELLGLVTARRLRTDVNPVLRWMAGNLIARYDVNKNCAPDRKHAPEKIDGMVALIMAIGRMMADTGDGGGLDLPADYEVAAA